MFYQSFSLLIISALFAFAPVRSAAQHQSVHAKNQWVFYDDNGKLNYKKLSSGDKIMDFSHAGYMGGGVGIPDVPVKITISPIAGDNSERIQQAINKVSSMKLVGGFRGAVLLEAGTYDCERELTINASGVVLRGSGFAENGTILNMTGKPHTGLNVRGRTLVSVVGKARTMTDVYVPSGADSFTLDDVSGMAVGDTLRITRPVTNSWVHFMGMDHLVRNGKAQTWVSGSITCDRVVSKIDGTRVFVSVPLTDSFDSKYLNPPGILVEKVTTKGGLSQIGIENLRIVSPAQTGTINERHHQAFTVGNITDGWVRNVDVFNTVNSVSVLGTRITLDRVNIFHTLATVGSAKPADLNGSGSQLLFNRCTISGDNVFFFSTGAKVTGPIVLLNCVFHGNGWIQPHQRWATGLLVDECRVPGGGIDFMNRGEYGSGHGWAVGWAVAWNCQAKSYLNQIPPGAANWVIGSRGEKTRMAMPFNKEPLEPEGIYDSHGIPVYPASLYLAQLYERLGEKALENIGYGKDGLAHISYEY